MTLEQVHHGCQVFLQVDDEVRVQLGKSSKRFLHEFLLVKISFCHCDFVTLVFEFELIN